MSARNQLHRRVPASAQTTIENATIAPTTTTLRLRGEEEDENEEGEEAHEVQRPRRRIRWDESVVNNEGMGRKSSKVCCIYHKTRALGESSSEESSSSESSSDDTDNEDGHGPVTGRRRRPSNEHHQHDEACSQHRHKGKAKRKPTTRNAYERTPKSNLKGSSTKNASG